MLGYSFFRLLYLLGSILWFATGIGALTIVWHVGQELVKGACR